MQLTHQPTGAGPERPEARAGDLETRGLLPQRQGGRVPVRDGAEPPTQHQTNGSHSLHAQVRR